MKSLLLCKRGALAWLCYTVGVSALHMQKREYWWAATHHLFPFFPHSHPLFCFAFAVWLLSNPFFSKCQRASAALTAPESLWHFGVTGLYLLSVLMLFDFQYYILCLVQSCMWPGCLTAVSMAHKFLTHKTQQGIVRKPKMRVVCVHANQHLSSVSYKANNE